MVDFATASVGEGYIMMRKITIDWSYPKDFNNMLCDERMSDIGLYYITRNFGGKISDLYIGKTMYSFGSRLASHSWRWVDDYRGSKQVRLGTIVSPKKLSAEAMNELISDAEATLIYLMRDKLLHNRQGTRSCSLYNRLLITNTGYRGGLPAEMYIPDEEWVEF